MPLYFQLAEYLRRELEKESWSAGDLFTTEQELEESFGVSRATVRRALEELVRDGLLVRITGRGTFVSDQRLHVTVPHLLSFSEEIERQGMTPSTRVLSVKRTKPPKDAALALGTSKDEQVLCVKRVRDADQKPLVYMIDYLSPHLEISSTVEFDQSLYSILEKDCGVRVEEAVHQVHAVLLTGSVAQALELDESAPGLYMRRTSYDNSHRPLVFEEAYCHGKRYQYEVRLRRRGGLRAADT